jgi:hypothetical protein
LRRQDSSASQDHPQLDDHAPAIPAAATVTGDARFTSPLSILGTLDSTPAAEAPDREENKDHYQLYTERIIQRLEESVGISSSSRFVLSTYRFWIFYRLKRSAQDIASREPPGNGRRRDLMKDSTR